MPRKSTQTTVEKPSEQTAVDLGLIVLDENGQLADDPQAIQEEVDGVVLAWRDRNARIAAMRREGKSLARIGQEFGLSGTRVYRICALAGVVMPPKAKPRAKTAKKKQ